MNNPVAFNLSYANEQEENNTIMNTKHYIDLYDHFDDMDLDERGDPRHPRNDPRKSPSRDEKFLKAQDDSRGSFNFTYQAARFESGWLLNSLGGFYEHQWISDVLRKVRGGKEASVYLCRPGAQVDAPLAAAKVYRPRMLRNLKQDHIYREGRVDLGADGKRLVKDADVHAVAKRTAYGEEVRHQSWIAYEFATMNALYAAGADIPRPYEMANNAILMGYVGDAGVSAPALSEISLERDEARVLFERVLHNIDIMLDNRCVHGDLSAYNILYWEGDIALIDFPQVVNPLENRNAYAIFQRDVARVCEYFDRQGVPSHPARLASSLWTKHGYAVAQEVHPRLLDAEDPRDRKLWKKQHPA